MISILQNHIANEGGHYAGKLYSWDVVNEIFNEDGALKPDPKSHLLPVCSPSLLGTWRSTIWYNTIGTSFVPIAFNAAHAADPSAKLYMNDYNVRAFVYSFRATCH